MNESLFDRNYRLGYYLFETMKVRNGRIENEELHLQRLEKSSREMAFPAQVNGQSLAQTWNDCMLRVHGQDPHRSSYRLNVELIPGEGNCLMRHRIGELPQYPARFRLGVHQDAVRLSTDPFWKWKTGSWGRNLHFMSKSGTVLDDIIFINERGDICETTRSNIYLIEGKRIRTPDISCGVLPGTVRQKLINQATLDWRGITLRIECDRIRMEELGPGSELLVSNALLGLAEAVFIP